MPQQANTYRGRFAPSPTGPLHLGSLIAALASYLDARHHRGTWLVRMEDLDPPREEAGAADSILHSLQHHGLHWDEDVLYQGTRNKAYEQALEELRAGQHLFACDCTRATLGPDGSCVGTCRTRQDAIKTPCALRIAVPGNTHITFDDALQGAQEDALDRQFRDFIVRRKDGLYAYQLAVVVDDAMQGITHVVRGSDLLDSTARQVLLQQCLDCATPHYCHLPVITNREGQKFSKQNHAPALRDELACDNLRAALRFLNQPAAPAGIDRVDELLIWATAHWALQQVPAVMSIPGESLGLAT